MLTGPFTVANVPVMFAFDSAKMLPETLRFEPTLILLWHTMAPVTSSQAAGDTPEGSQMPTRSLLSGIGKISVGVKL